MGTHKMFYGHTHTHKMHWRTHKNALWAHTKCFMDTHTKCTEDTHKLHWRTHTKNIIDTHKNAP